MLALNIVDRSFVGLSEPLAYSPAPDEPKAGRGAISRRLRMPVQHEVSIR